MSQPLHTPSLLKALSFGLSALALALVTITSSLASGEYDPFDPYNLERPDSNRSQPGASAPELYMEAMNLLAASPPDLLDARTKLLQALAADPTFYPAHTQLAFYYISHVGHYRLALAYARRAFDLFLQKNGPPPYTNRLLAAEHAQLLYLLSQARLNLDDYQGALAALDEYEQNGYMAGWYPGTRSWVLMKLGRLQEALALARVGVLNRSDVGRNLNMLGILLSMTGDPQGALRVFDEAIRFEVSLGDAGQPSTPLNNLGEVYKEMYNDSEAMRTWSRAKSLPDGCEHVLPSLNYAMVAMDHLSLRDALKSINSFLACFKQYTLRNDEEHRGLISLIRGRVAYWSGLPFDARQYFLDALENTQWFGRIGTSERDLRAAALLSLAQANEGAASILRTTSADNLIGRALNEATAVSLEVQAWWVRRRARLLLAEQLNNLEDLRIRNTDSLLEYPTLGQVFVGMPAKVVERRIGDAEGLDGRAASKPYYLTFRAEAALARRANGRAHALLNEALKTLRPDADAMLQIHATALLARVHASRGDATAYTSTLRRLASLHPPALRLYSLAIPVALGRNSRPLPSGSPFRLARNGEVPLATITITDTEVLLDSDVLPSGRAHLGPGLDEALETINATLFTDPVGAYVRFRGGRANVGESGQSAPPSDRTSAG